MNQQRYQWHELNLVPERAGIYSWYYRIDLSNKDIDACIKKVENSEEEKKPNAIKDFLKKRIFDHYKESPYQVSLTGKLKPPYEGKVESQVEITEGLVARICEDPSRLHKLKEVLRTSIPIFASPIYIGVTKNLLKRLLQHQNLIKKFLDSKEFHDLNKPEFISEGVDEELKRDLNFAQEVTNIRKLVISNLEVWTFDLPIDEKILYDLENILNRINYPLCGRN